MAQKATRDQKQQVETLSQIDSLITILGDYPEASLPLTMNVNPFSFLLDVCKSLGIFDELMLFLVKLIQYELPLIELGIKGILLANLKEVVSCSSDPFIPKKLRKVIGSNNNINGMTFSIRDLDYNNLLNINPLSNGSEYSYLGINREYKATYQIKQRYERISIKNKTSNAFKLKDEADNWVNKYKKRYSTKYNNDKKYEIVDLIFEDDIEGKKGKIKHVYYGTITVYEIITPPEDNNYYVNEVKYCYTYAEADSYIVTRDMKYSSKYDENIYEIIRDITPIINTTPYELSRAIDFNAFLWFVTHMANFNDPVKLPFNGDLNFQTQKPNGVQKDFWGITDYGELKGYLETKYNATYIEDKEEGGPLGVIRLTAKSNKEEDVIPPGLLGSTFTVHDGQDSSLYHLCIKSAVSSGDNPTKIYYIVPATSDNISLNWYGDRRKYFNFLEYYGSPKKEAAAQRKYYREIGICNIEYETQINDKSDYEIFDRNKIRFTVLPKPLVHIPQFLEDTITMPFKRKMILFNSFGKYDINGKYSVFTTYKDGTDEPYCYKNTGSNSKEYPCYYELANKSHQGQGLYLFIPNRWSHNSIMISESSSDPMATKNTYNRVPPSCLYECYPNLTVYEFNYDYVMSQRLFDARVVAGELIQSLLNCRLGISGNLELGIHHNVVEGSERIVELIEDMITADTYSSSDCYSSFSNDKYDEMSRKTERKKTQGYHFEGSDRTVQIDTTEIEKILNEYDNPDITQEGQTDVLNRAFKQVTANITAATEDKETWDIKFNIIGQLIKDLTFVVVKSILTPKMLLILIVNKQLLGDDTEWTGDVLSNILDILLKTIKEIVKEIKNIILSQLLEFVLGFLRPKFEELASLIIKEYTEQYRDQIAALLKACAIGWGSGAATADTKLDVVNYADIDPVSEVTQDKQC